MCMLTSTSEKQNYTGRQKASSHLVQIQALNLTNNENINDNNKLLSVRPIIGIASYCSGWPRCWKSTGMSSSWSILKWSSGWTTWIILGSKRIAMWPCDWDTFIGACLYPNLCLLTVPELPGQEAMILHHLKEMKEEMAPLSKMAKIRTQDTREMQLYMKQKSLENSWIGFIWETNMIDTRCNMNGKYKKDQYQCPQCFEGS